MKSPDLIVAISALFLLTGCEVDKKLYREVLMECLDKAQKQPAQTTYNDTAEVVGACGNQAQYIARKGSL
jgi:hypothetical protein